MKNLIRGMLLLSPLFARAEFLPTNVDWCQEVSCTPEMKEVNKAFSENVHVAISPESSSVYSGTCYRQPSKDDSRAQMAMFAVVESDRDNLVTYGGLCAAADEKTNFKGLTSESARNLLREKGEKTHAVTLETTKGRVTILNGADRTTAYLRTTEDASELYLLVQTKSKDKDEERRFCRLRRH